MSKLNKNYLIDVFSSLGSILKEPDEILSEIISTEKHYNAWFTPESVTTSVMALASMLNAADVKKWLDNYSINFDSVPKKIGLILAGNIPLVGFHDVLCVLASGNYALIKASTNDLRLIRYILELIVSIAPELGERYSFVDRLDQFDAVIATGSNNTSRYFEYYFGKVPNIIRKNRNSIAILTGNETNNELRKLGFDIFDYYGLGCRNVSKVLVPENYDFVPFFEAIEEFHPIINHHKYNNNYDYNKSIYLVNKEKHFDNGFLLVKEDGRMVSPLSVLYYEEYKDLDELNEKIALQRENIQCIVSKMALNGENQVVDFGESQQPKLSDYADGIDTMEFLSSL